MTTDLINRKSARGGMRNVRELRPCPLDFEVRDVPNGTGGTNAIFEGFACITESPYEMEDPLGPFDETVSRGAFKKTLSERPNCVFLVNHDHNALPLARTLARGSGTGAGTLQLQEVEYGNPAGLHVRAVLDRGRQDVRDALAAVDSGVLDEMSFGFRVTRQKWSDDFSKRHIQEVNLQYGDVSIVSFAANPATAGTLSVRRRGAVAGRPAGGIFVSNHTPQARAHLALLRAGGTIPKPAQPLLSNHTAEARRRLGLLRRVTSDPRPRRPERGSENMTKAKPMPKPAPKPKPPAKPQPLHRPGAVPQGR